MYEFMKKFVFLCVMSLVIIIAGCSKKMDITDNNLNVESCDKYFELMDCVLINENDERYTTEMRDELREYVKSIQEEWESLDEETLDKKCSDELLKFETMSDRLNEIGCSMD